MWVLRGLRNGVLTTRWPARHDSQAGQERGPARVLAQSPGGAAPPDGAAFSDGRAFPESGAFPDGAADLPELCPAGAISYSPGAGLRLDQGRCILCGRCVAARPDLFAWSQGPGVASLTPAALLTPLAGESEEELAQVRAGLRQRTRAFGRSVHIRHVDAGSDGSEEWEVLALLNPVYDVHRLGIFFTASPRHADVLLVTGAGALGMAAPLRRTYDAMPHPKIVIAAGTDAVSGGIVSPSYATLGGIGDLVPVDVWVPGSPPSPFQLLHALLLGLGRLPADRAQVRS